MQLQPGDIIVFRDKWVWNEPITWLSFFVRLFTRCYFNHTALVADDGWQLVINEAVAKGIISRRAKDHLFRSGVTIMILRPSIPFDNAKAMSKVGVPYDFWTLIFFQAIYRITGIWIGKTTHGDDKLVCSEYAAWVYGLPKWWLMSTREIIESPAFSVVYDERQSLDAFRLQVWPA
jgi:hypothetical protein